MRAGHGGQGAYPCLSAINKDAPLVGAFVYGLGRDENRFDENRRERFSDSDRWRSARRPWTARRISLPLRVHGAAGFTSALTSSSSDVSKLFHSAARLCYASAFGSTWQRLGGAAVKRSQNQSPSSLCESFFPPRSSASPRAYLSILSAAPPRRCERILLRVELELTARRRAHCVNHFSRT